jgi:pimeloyl-ACP methyl ester carboxylesterase
MTLHNKHHPVTPRPRRAERYRELLAARELTDVLVVGSSLGGWIGAELALRDGARFTLVEEAGHLPQIEQPAATFAALDAFVAR